MNDDAVRREILEQLVSLGFEDTGLYADPLTGATRPMTRSCLTGGHRPPYYGQLIRHLRAGFHILLVGQAGSYKTQSGHAVARELDAELVVVQLHRDSTIEELRGVRGLHDGHTTFEYGPVARALMAPRAILLLEEINMPPAGTMAGLNGLLDGTRSLAIPETGELLRANDDFRVIATCNPDYEGAMAMNQALVSRFVTIEATPDVEFELRLLADTMPDLVRDHGHLLRRIIECIRTAREEGRLEFDLDFRSILQFATEWCHTQDPVLAFRRILAPKFGQPARAFLPVRDEMVAALEVLISEQNG